jgi:hypothetical protein
MGGLTAGFISTPLGRRMNMARARARRERYHLVLPILEDLNSVEVARMQVMDALNAGHIDAKHAGVLLFGLEGIASDLRSDKAPRMSAYDPAIDTALRAEDYPDFEEKYGLPKDLDLSQRAGSGVCRRGRASGRRLPRPQRALGLSQPSPP